jgi:hypothetical protein
MSIGTIGRFSRAARIAYSRHPAALLYRAWRRVAGDQDEGEFGGVLLLPLAGLAFSLFLLSTPGASEAVAAACSAACLQ